MVSYIPNYKIPTVNVCQEIQRARGREINEEVDIVIPSYLVDRRIIRSLELNNVNYLQFYLKNCPRNIERYFFLETVTCVSPTIRNVVICNLLGFAILYRAIDCIRILINSGADPFQSSYFIEWTSFSESQRKILLYEAPAVILLSNSIQERFRDDCLQMLSMFHYVDAELHTQISIRRQQFEPPGEPVSITVRYADTWECLEKELEKQGGQEVVKSKNILGELKAAYKSSHFDNSTNTLT